MKLHCSRGWRSVVVALTLAGVWPGLANGQFTAIRLGEPGFYSFAQAVRDGVVGGYRLHGAVEPVLWSLPGPSVTSLGFNTQAGGIVYAMNATHQFGVWGPGAAMWSGTASSVVSLHPPGAFTSSILAASSTQQGGWTDLPGQEHMATLWSGSASSATYLHPSGAIASSINAMTDSRQGGGVSFPGQPGQGWITHAALWSGSAASFVDLNPAGYHTSGINGMFGNQQVGAVFAPGSTTRAAMWSGTPESFVSMHPFPDGLSTINATCGSAQVGYMNSLGLGGAGVRAVIWFGTPESVMDLSQFLPPGYGQSVATCVEEVNGVFTVGGYVRYGFTDQAFVWVGVPAPAGGMLLLISGAFALRRRRKL